MMNVGTYGEVPSANSNASGGETLFGIGAQQKRTAMSMLGNAAAEEQQRNQRNQQVETERKAGNSQLGSTLAGAAGGAAFGPWGALIGGAIGAIAGYQL